MNALSAYLYELLMAHGFFREIRDIQLSCEEALMNACIHGNRDDATKHVTLAVTFAENVLSIEIGDEGPGFDYATALRNTKAHRGVFAASGRGIYMMSRHMDAISYKDNGATVILIKNRK
jgi:serine/threonine-protein kinase RsbW